jgi:hypothetical protein
MRITVLDLTGHPLPLLAGLPRAGAQIISWLSSKLPEAEFRSISVEVDNEILPEPNSFDGLIRLAQSTEFMTTGLGYRLYALFS